MKPLARYMLKIKGRAKIVFCPEYARQYALAEKSGLFDRGYYLETYPDVEASGMDPLQHFLERGWREGRNPSPGFDVKEYVRRNPDLRREPQNPLIHAIGRSGGGARDNDPAQIPGAASRNAFSGASAVPHIPYSRGKEMIRASGYFDESYYLERNRDVRDAEIDALDHFCMQGWKEYRNPSARFNTYGYLSTYPEAAESGMNPLLYFLLRGCKRSHDPCSTIRPRKIPEEEAASLKGKLAGCSTLFSVIMPTYNRAAVVCTAVESVLGQSYGHFELIISDDGSRDGTVAMLQERYASQIHRGIIRIIPGGHRGVSAARNAALRRARGEWIAYLDSDTTWHPHYLLFAADALASNPDRKNCYACIQVNDRIGQRVYLRDRPFNLGDVRNRNYIDLNVYAHHRSLTDALGGFDESLTRFVDWDMIQRHASCYRPVHIRHVLAQYYLDDSLGNISAVSDADSNLEKLRANFDACRDRLVALKVPAPDLERVPQGGVCRVARALQRELIAQGYLARLDAEKDWYNRECEDDAVVIVLGGATKYKPDPSARNVLWYSGTPQGMPRSEMRKYDLVLVPSRKHAEECLGDDMPPVYVAGPRLGAEVRRIFDGVIPLRAV